MAFDASPEEMYPEYFEGEDVPINDPDTEPHRPVHGYGWYFKVYHVQYGHFNTEAEAWEAYERVRDEMYTDDEEDE